MNLKDRCILVWSFTRRQILERYSGSALGLVWAFVNPLVGLALWTFLFTTVIRLRHGGMGGAAGYAIMLWVGMIPWIAFSEAIGAAMGCIRNHANLIKRTLFPIEVLPVAAVLAGFVHSLFALVILLPILLFVFHSVPWTIVYLPIVILYQLAFTIAVAYLVSVATTLVRDAVQIVTNLLTTLMYLTPIIYPHEAIPEPYRTVMLANPIAVIVISYRRMLLEGLPPSWKLLGAHTLVVLVLLWLARRTFQSQRSSFAEII